MDERTHVDDMTIPMKATPKVDPTSRLFRMAAALIVGHTASWADMFAARGGHRRVLEEIHWAGNALDEAKETVRTDGGKMHRKPLCPAAHFQPLQKGRFN